MLLIFLVLFIKITIVSRSILQRKQEMKGKVLQLEPYQELEDWCETEVIYYKQASLLQQ